MIKPPLNYVNKMHLEEYFKKIAPTLNNFVEKYLVHKGVRASFRSVVTEPPKSPPDLHLPKGIYFPDYKTYKVEDVPELMEVQKQLAARGLKDPWLRNYVWRYHPDHVGTKKGRLIFSLGRGLRTGAVLIFLTWIYETYYKEQDHHGHGGHHGSKVEHDLSSH